MPELKTMNRSRIRFLLAVAFAATLLSTPLLTRAQQSGPLPFFPFSSGTQQKPAPKPVLPWLTPTRSTQRNTFALPWNQPPRRPAPGYASGGGGFYPFGLFTSGNRSNTYNAGGTSFNPFSLFTSGNRSNSYGAGSTGFNPFSLFSTGSRGFNPFASQGTGFNPFAMGTSPGFGTATLTSGLSMMAGPMMQGAVGIMTPFAINYMVASMNPTTMSTFFDLMTQPNTFSGIGIMNPMSFTNPGTFGGARHSTFPFMQAPRQAAPAFPFMAFPQATPQRRPAKAPSFPFNPFSFVGK